MSARCLCRRIAQLKQFWPHYPSLKIEVALIRLVAVSFGGDIVILFIYL